MFHKIKSVAPLPEYRLLVSFAEGLSKTYDMKPLFVSYPVFAPLRDVPGLFQQVRTDPGGYGISWNDDLDLDSQSHHRLTVCFPSRTPPSSGVSARARSARLCNTKNWWRAWMFRSSASSGS